MGSQKNKRTDPVSFKCCVRSDRNTGDLVPTVHSKCRMIDIQQKLLCNRIFCTLNFNELYPRPTHSTLHKKRNTGRYFARQQRSFPVHTSNATVFDMKIHFTTFPDGQRT